MFARLGFRWRLIASFVSLILLSLLLASVVFSVAVQNTERQRAVSRLTELVVPVANLIDSETSEARTPADYSAILKRIATDYNVRILYVDSNNFIYQDTSTHSNGKGFQLQGDLGPNDGRIHQINFVDQGINIHYTGFAYRQVQSPTFGNPGARTVSGFSIILAVPDDTLDTSWFDLVPSLLGAAALALLVALLVALVLARSISRPLIRVTEAAQEIARGNYGQQVPVEEGSDDELGQLGRSFNKMSSEVALSQQAMRDFVANVSHELKTPLTSIQGFSQAVMDGTADEPAAQQRSAAIIYEEAARMRRLVDELLDLSRIESGQVEMARHNLDLAGLLERTLAKLDPLAQAKELRLQSLWPLPPYESLARVKGGDTVAVEDGGTPPTARPIVAGDMDRLEQVFTNIIGNAIKYTPRGGVVRLWLTPVTPKQPHAPAEIAISVANNGPTIPPTHLPRIFERFYQVDPARARKIKGDSTGLGLAIAKEIVELHTGTIGAASGVGPDEAWTVFWVVLPLAAPFTPPPAFVPAAPLALEEATTEPQS